MDATQIVPPCTLTGLNLTTDQLALEAFRDSLREPVRTSHRSSGALQGLAGILELSRQLSHVNGKICHGQPKRMECWIRCSWASECLRRIL